MHATKWWVVAEQIRKKTRGQKQMFMLRHIPLHVSVIVYKLPTYNFVFENYLLTLTNNRKINHFHHGYLSLIMMLEPIQNLMDKIEKLK